MKKNNTATAAATSNKCNAKNNSSKKAKADDSNPTNSNNNNNKNKNKNKNASAIKQATRKFMNTACCVIPPQDQWDQIQAIREQHDHAFNRWMPHINILYPFIPVEQFKSGAQKLQTRIQEAALPSFSIRLRIISFFDNHKCLMHLKPEVILHLSADDGAGDAVGGIINKNNNNNNSKPAPAESKPSGTLSGTSSAKRRMLTDADRAINPLIRLQQIAQEVFFNSCEAAADDKQYTPHLTLGEFPSPKEMRAFLASSNVESTWQDIEFPVNEIYFVTRDTEKDTPFYIHTAIKLNNNNNSDTTSTSDNS